jgi:hypothetical protein
MKHGHAPQHCHVIELEAPDGSTSAYYVEKSQRLLLSPVKGQRRAVYSTLIHN